MIKARFSYLILTAVIAVLAMALASSVRPSTPKTQLQTEIRVLEKYFDDLVAYDKQSTELSKRARLVSTDLDPLQRKSDDLKGRLSEVQNSVREIVKKLKAANEWDNVDSLIVIAEARHKSIFQQTSFKKLLEDSSNNLSSQGKEISAPLDNLRKRLTSRYGNRAELQFVRAGYGAPVPVGAPDSLGCTIGKLALVAIRLSGGTPTDLAYNAVFRQCAPAGAVSPF